MNKSKLSRNQKRLRRHARVRSVVTGTASRPRLSVFRSLMNTTVQLIDDENGKTLASATTKKDLLSGEVGERKGKLGKAYLLGLTIGKKAKDLGVEAVVFDRGGYSYHGRVQAVAEGAREAGLQF